MNLTGVPRSADVSADDLRCLLAVARAGRMVSAAALLQVDHTTVKRRIARLEAALGARLLDRGADGWELTTLGREIATRAAPIDQLVDGVVAAATAGAAAVRGTVRVVAPDAFGSLFVAPALARVQIAHPAVSVELVTSTRPLSLRGTGFDIAVSIGSTGNSRVPSERLAPYLLRLYASSHYLHAHDPIRSVTDLEGHALVFYVDSLLTVQELDLAPALGGMRLGFGSTNVFAQLEATRHGAGIGLLHSFMADRDPDLVAVLPDEVAFPLHFSISMRSDAVNVPAVAIVRDALHDEVRARAAELRPS